MVSGPGEYPHDPGRHAHPLPIGGPQPPHPGEKDADGDEQRQPAVAVRVPPTDQLLVLAIPFGLEDLLDFGVGLRPLLQLLDARLLHGSDVPRVEILRHEPGRRGESQRHRGKAEP
jgi:hypothetical protein